MSLFFLSAISVRTLVLETSTIRGSVAVLDEDALVFEEDFVADRSHSSQLFTVIERALGESPSPGKIVVGLGPGSYAGVRISISAAIGLSVATGAELIGIPSVAALAGGEYLAIGDARRGSFYFAHVREGELLEGPLLLARELLESRLSGNSLPVYTSDSTLLPRAQTRLPSAARLGRLALVGTSVCARGALEPIYLREPHITTPRANP